MVMAMLVVMVVMVLLMVIMDIIHMRAVVVLIMVPARWRRKKDGRHGGQAGG